MLHIFHGFVSHKHPKTGVLIQEQRHSYTADIEANSNNSSLGNILKLEGNVILCGGAINSPQLLMLSGIGDKDHLNSVGIHCVHNLKGV